MQKSEPKSKLASQHTLKNLIAELDKLARANTLNNSNVRRLLESYKIEEPEWKEYCHFSKERYTRHLIHELKGKFHMLILCWNEDQFSPVHDHASSNCFVKVLKGKVVEYLYEKPKEVHQVGRNGALVLKKKSELGEDNIGLHKMGNESKTEKAVTLHIYVPPLLKFKKFDEKTSEAKPCVCDPEKKHE